MRVARVVGWAVLALVVASPAQRIATAAQSDIATKASRLEMIAAKAKSAGKARVDVLDPLVEPLVFSNPDNEFRNVGAVVISHIQMDVATVVTRDWVFSWAKV